VVLHLYGNRVLHLTSLRRALPVSCQIGPTAKAGVRNSAIAATGAARDPTVPSGNLRHFALLGVRAHSPLESLPAD
jgi:hypothetical protein